MKRNVLTVVSAAASLGALMLFSAGGASGSPALRTVAAAPRIPAGAKQLGAVSGSTAETGTVVLRPRDEGGLTRFIAAVTDRQSPLFHQYLAAGQFRSRFGPAQATIDAVSSQLAGSGLRVTGVASDGLMVDFSGSASQVEKAFGTGLERVKLADGSIGQATTGALRLPSSVAGAVTTVIGLDNLIRARTDAVMAPPSARGSRPAAGTTKFTHPSGSPTACAAASTAAEQFGGLTDDQIANSYGAFGLYSAGDLGAGQHIAVFELEPFAPSDVRTFDTCYFGATVAAQMAGRLKVISVDGGLPAGTGGGEAALDVQDVSALAPGANIDVYNAPNSTFGLFDNYAAIVNADVDKIVTTSWLIGCEQSAQQGAPGIQEAENSLFQQAAAQGQSVFAAAGDTGDDGCNLFRAPQPVSGQNPLSGIDPSTQPYVISAGGTTIDDATQPPQERVWNDGANWGAGGGGISQSWTMPSWQLDARVPGIVLPGSGYTAANSVEKEFGYPQNFCQAYLSGATSSTPCRTVPDVSAQADEFTGAVTIYWSGGWFTIGGTSSAAPLWAGMLALVDASSTCAASPATRSGVGFVAPLLYAVASNAPAYAASFNDITVGNNDIYGLDNGKVFPAATGYDLATGLGSPQLTSPSGGSGLAFYLCSYGAKTSRPAVTRLTPAFGPTTGATVTITGSGFKPGATAEVAGIQVGTWEAPASKFTVNSNTSITATFPPAADTLPPGSPAPQDGAGPADVVVTLKDGESSIPDAASTFQYVDESGSSPVPSVMGVSPYGGPEASPSKVTILGSGFTGATKVTFGGVAPASFKVVSPYEIQATPPAYSSVTTCGKSVAGESPTTDICQAQVQVSNVHGASALGLILPPYEGELNFSPATGVLQLPPGCKCEEEPAPTEFDYVPAPSISSISTSTANPGSLASSFGGTLVTVTGKGFNLQTLSNLNIGDPSQASSLYYGFTYLSGTKIQFIAPQVIPSAAGATVQPLTLPFSARTIAGQAPGVGLVYAGIPQVTEALNPALGRNGAADSGGTPITLTGQGFRQAVGPLVFSDVQSFIFATQYSYAVHSDTAISAQTVSTLPGLDDVEVCSVTGCAANAPADYFYLYPPGDPKVDSVTPTSGPVGGGTNVTIKGQNLGCVTGVFFGSAVAEKFSNNQAILDCGSTDTVNATAPPGQAGSTVKVTVTTVESDFTGSGPSSSTGLFTYNR